MVEFTSSPFAFRLLLLRKCRKLEQREMALLLGIPRGTYSNYESGVRVPPLGRIVAIVARLGVSADYLMGISDFELPYESGVKYGILRKLRNVKDDDLQPYTPRMEQSLLVAENDSGHYYGSAANKG